MPYTETAIYCSSARYTAVAAWAATTAYTIGQIVRQLAAPTVGNERCFVCVTAGTSFSSEPAWTISRGGVTSETGGVAWRECTGQAGVNGDSVNCNSWQANQGTITLGCVIQNTARTAYFICITSAAGGTGAEPAWNTALGGNTTDGSATWKCIRNSGSFGNWAAPCARLRLPLNNATTWLVNANMTVFVGDDHAETNSSGTSTFQAASNCQILCVDHTAGLPAGSSNLKTTASVTESGTGVIFINSNSVYVYGVQIIWAAAGALIIGNGGTKHQFENCTFSLTNATATNSIQIGDGSASAGAAIVFNGCTFYLQAIGQAILGRSGSLKLENSALTGTFGDSTHPVFGGSAFVNFTIEGCDLSNIPAGSVLVGVQGSNSPNGYFLFKDCKLPSSFLTYVGGDASIRESVTVDFARADSGGTAYRNERHARNGTQTTSTAAVRTGGAVDGATPISHQIAPTANALFPYQTFSALPLTIWNAITGSNRNVTLYGIVNDSRVPNNDEVWFDCEYLGSGSTPQGSYARGGKTVLGTAVALTADTSAWDVPAVNSSPRINSQAYALGAVITVPDNATRTFWCTTAGTSAASELASVNASTFNPSDYNSTVTLSNGNLTATSGAGGQNGVRSASTQTGGKFYLEWTIGATLGSGTMFGVCTGAESLSNANLYLGASVADFSGGSIYVFGSSETSIGTPVAGDVICAAVDLTNKMIWFRRNAGPWNNSGTANPAANIGGYDISAVYPASPMYFFWGNSSGNGASCTVNCGGSSFAQTAPSGFSAWNVNAQPTIAYSNATDRQIVIDGSAQFTAITGANSRVNSWSYTVGQYFKVASNPGRIFFCTAAGTSGPSETSGAAWNPSDSSNVTLTSANQTVTSTGSDGGVRSAISYSSGKYYFEGTITALGLNFNFGVAKNSQVLGAANCLNSAQVQNNGSIVSNNTVVGSVGVALSSGMVICVAVDLGNLNIWIRANNGNWNNSGTANPATNTGGITLTSASFSGNAAYMFAAFNGSGSTIVTNFGASAFTYTVPSGFSAWQVASYTFAACPDGGVVLDGSATFRAGCRFSQTLQLNAPVLGQPGYIYCYPRFGRASMTFYLDPLISLS